MKTVASVYSRTYLIELRNDQSVVGVKESDALGKRKRREPSRDPGHEYIEASSPGGGMLQR